MGFPEIIENQQGPEAQGPDDDSHLEVTFTIPDSVADDDPQEDGIVGGHMLVPEMQPEGHDAEVGKDGHITPERELPGQPVDHYIPGDGKRQVQDANDQSLHQLVALGQTPMDSNRPEHHRADRGDDDPGPALGQLFVDRGHARLLRIDHQQPFRKRVETMGSFQLSAMKWWI